VKREPGAHQIDNEEDEATALREGVDAGMDIDADFVRFRQIARGKFAYVCRFPAASRVIQCKKATKGECDDPDKCIQMGATVCARIGA
jgi:hypothetical protein